MFDFKWDLGTILLLLYLVIYLIAIVLFPYTKRNGLFGIRTKKSFVSEEIWHKVHVRSSIATIPYAVINFVGLFLSNEVFKEVLAHIVLVAVIVTWSIICNVTANKAFKQKREEERLELEETIKKESGWR